VAEGSARGGEGNLIDDLFSGIDAGGWDSPAEPRYQDLHYAPPDEGSRRSAPGPNGGSSGLLQLQDSIFQAIDAGVPYNQMKEALHDAAATESLEFLTEEIPVPEDLRNLLTSGSRVAEGALGDPRTPAGAPARAEDPIRAVKDALADAVRAGVPRDRLLLELPGSAAGR